MCTVQRTEVMPRDRNLAEKEPAKFAALLIERLQQVKNDRDSVEKVMQSINQTKVCNGIICLYRAGGLRGRIHVNLSGCADCKLSMKVH